MKENCQLLYIYDMCFVITFGSTSTDFAVDILYCQSKDCNNRLLHYFCLVHGFLM